ncbi:hypothetical protein DL771_009420 [Monosporascus sp. 5C6A]|nr:hypothetical protein DL771_009420 [Monosporascus sp. 5C6A]
MDSNEWESHRSTIVHLYLEEGYTLHRVAAYMKEMHGFDKNQFEYKLGKWGVRKNATKDEWQYLRRQMQKREGRISEVAIRGRIIPEHKVRRGLQRYTTIPTAREFQAGVPSPKTPEGDIIRVRSPSIGDLQHSWPNNLPWFQFKERVRFKVLHLALEHGTHSHLQMVHSIPEAISATIVNLFKSIPEIGGEGGKTQQLCNAGNMNSMATQLLVVLLFRLSNKFHQSRFDSEKAQKIHDDLIMHLIKEILKSNPAFLADLLRSRGHTSDAIKEAVYASAVRASKYEIVSQLLKAGVDPNLPVPVFIRQKFDIERGKASMTWGNPILHTPSGLAIAAYRLDTRLAVMLLEAGATVYGNFLLYIVAAGDNHDRTVEIAQLLVRAETKVDLPFAMCKSSVLPKRTLKEIFVTACWAGDLETAEKLLGLDIELDEGWELGITPLVATAWNPDTRLAETLLQRGARFALGSGDPATAAILYPQAELLGGELIQAITMRNEKLVSDLLARAPDILSSEKEGETVLEAAAASGNIQVITSLFSSGSRYRSRALFKAVEAAIVSKDIKIVELISAHPAKEDNVILVRLLIHAGADVNMPAYPYSGVTALQAAAARGNLEIATLLIQRNADVNAPAAKYGGRTALEAAAEYGRLDMVHFLLESGANLEGPMRIHYVRAVHFAIREGHLEVVKYLKEHGAWTDRDQELQNMRGVWDSRCHFVYNEDTQDWKIRGMKYDKEKRDWYSVAYSDFGTDSDSYSEFSDDTAEYANSSSQTDDEIPSAVGLTDEAMENYFDLEAFLEEPLEGRQVAMPSSTMSWIMGVDASAEEWNTEEHTQWGPMLTEGGEGFPETFDENDFWNI